MANIWTEQQKKVIDLHDRNILVSAAAGSGKTAVLVERIISMITREENPVDIDRLVIVTFTNMAAYEMRMRIMAAISDRLAQEPGNRHLERQLTLVHSAKITTIDSFCLNIVKSYFNEAGLDPAFRVADEGELKLLSSDVLKAFLEECYQSGDEDFFDFVDCFAPQKNDGKIEDYILKLYRFSQSYPWPEKWLGECLREYEHGSAEEYMKGKNMQALQKFVKDMLDSVEEDVQRSLEICKTADGPYMYLEAIEADAVQIKRLTQAEGFDETEGLLKLLSFGRLSSKRDERVDAEKKELVKEIRDGYKKTIDKLKKDFFQSSSETLYRQSVQCGRSVRTMIQLTLGYMQRIEAAKREKKIISFSDMEHTALNILVREEEGSLLYSAAADELAARYDEIMIDEYQDSNLVQEMILNSISGERFGKNNVFMVGDVKQSIYKFRLARPDLFIGKYDSYTEEDSPYQKIELFQNFRSRKTVLDSVNAVFENIMTRRLGKVDYDGNARLNAGAVFPASDSGFGVTQVCLLEHKDGQELDSIEAEAVLAADIIINLVSGKSGKMVYDKENGTYRLPALRDIVILLRSIKGWADTYVEVLNTKGIAAYSESASGYFGTVEIRTLLSCLAVIDNPRQDIPLAAVMKSYFAGFTDDELALIRAEHMESSLYDAAADCAKTKDNVKVIRLMEFIGEYRRYSRYMDISSLIWKLSYDTGYYDYVGGMPAGAERQANINMLVEKARQYGSTSYKGLFHFLRYIEKLKTYEVDFAGASLVSENDNIVRVMSIHKSKGLEFPVVILAGMEKGFNNMDARDGVIIDPDNGIGIDYVDIERHVKKSTPAKKAVAGKIMMDNLAEEQRILYVAMTRAREMLYMTGCTRDAKKELEKWSRAVGKGSLTFRDIIAHKNYMDMIMPAVFGSGSSYFRVNVVGEEDFEEMKLCHMEVPAEENEDPADESMTEFVYPHKLYDIPVKMSVSEIKHRSMDSEEEPSQKMQAGDETGEPVPQFLTGEKKSTGAEKGSAYHAFLEHLDYGDCDSTEAIKKQIAACCSAGFLSEEWAACIREEDILRFVRSEIGDGARKAWQNGKLFREKQFMTGIEAGVIYKNEEMEGLVVVQGIIDMYYETDDGIILVDYKTDRVPYGEAGRNELIRRYGEQLNQYRRAIEMILEKKVAGIKIYSFTLAEVIDLLN